MEDINKKYQESCNNLAKTYAYEFSLMKIQCIACQIGVQALAMDLIKAKILKIEDFIEFVKKRANFQNTPSGWFETNIEKLK